MFQSYIQIKRAVYIDAYYYHRHLIRQEQCLGKKREGDRCSVGRNHGGYVREGIENKIVWIYLDNRYLILYDFTIMINTESVQTNPGVEVTPLVPEGPSKVTDEKIVNTQNTPSVIKPEEKNKRQNNGGSIDNVIEKLPSRFTRF